VIDVAASAALARPVGIRPASFGLAVFALAGTLGGAEAVDHFAGTFWGTIFFAAIFFAIIHLAVLLDRRGAVGDERAALLAVASLIPLERLLVLSVPALPFLRLYPSALWVLPMILVSAYAYRAQWIARGRPRLLGSSGDRRWTSLAIQIGIVAAGGALGLAAAYTIPYTGSHVLIYPDPAKLSGAVLFALAGGAEELAWRGVLQPLAADMAGYAGIIACFLASAYLAVAWMGLEAALPVIMLSGLTSIAVYRTRDLTGSLAAHVVLNLIFVILR